MGEVVRHKPDRRGPSQSKIKDFCQLSQRESQVYAYGIATNEKTKMQKQHG